jgi:Tfp pilus assembly protein PilW
MLKMASPISSTNRDIAGKSASAFTLVELLVSAGLSGMILVGVLSAFLMIARISWNIQSYTEIEATARKGLDTISREVRSAYDVYSYSDTSIDLMIPDSSATRNALAYYVQYSFDASTKSIKRTQRDTSHSNPVTTTVISGVQQITPTSSWENKVFHYFNLIPTSGAALGIGYVNGTPIPAGTAGSNEITVYNAPSAIQQIEMKFLILRTRRTVADATNKVLSARFIIRNK